jgi:hypothetical protein
MNFASLLVAAVLSGGIKVGERAPDSDRTHKGEGFALRF